MKAAVKLFKAEWIVVKLSLVSDIGKLLIESNVHIPIPSRHI
jgi:hypothetical protein